ncbi:PAS domain-containing protein [Cognatiyoonia sp. IB215182]|uniref:PAS domain-containing protein n=1 Tax=Cognatiyoonia sp. IB215182 TaxID=3097353 RepID=UPI002A13A64B|nr:PAS domain-containing protein [Cognatiyoonia sp. IB215182]MDX8351986.1 PAS domain-containing protein [Cognatiyoonia sp. IB215182]
MTTASDIPTRRRSDKAGANDATLKSLEAYWQNLRHAQKIPSRNDIEPRQIDDALPHAFILQRVAPGVARMRVAGQNLHDLLKMDARGMPISTLILPEARDEIAELIETAFTTPAIVAIPLLSPGTILRQELTGTMLLLPLLDAKGETTRILGALVTDDAPGNRPRRFQIQPGKAIRNDPLRPQLASVQTTPRQTKKEPSTSRPALRLVVNNG